MNVSYRLHSQTHSLLVMSLLLCTSFLGAQNKLEQVQRTPLVIGETITLQSQILDESRTLHIYLPYSYHQDTSQTYPTVYVLDGSLDEDFLHIVGLVQFASFPWIKMIPESIVVGVGNVDRQRDFTAPSTIAKDIESLPSSGKSSNFIRFLQDEIQPHISQTYRTSGSRTIVGQSLAGLLATEILYHHASLFDKYIIVSPSLWWNNQALLKETPKPIDHPKSIFIAVGKEGEIMESLAAELYANLLSKTHGDHQIHFSFLPERDHGDALHLAVYQAFEQFGKQQTKVH